jgi:hypothetical protein
MVPEYELELTEPERKDMELGIKSAPTQEAMEREAARIEAERAMGNGAMAEGNVSEEDKDGYGRAGQEGSRNAALSLSTSDAEVELQSVMSISVERLTSSWCKAIQ